VWRVGYSGSPWELTPWGQCTWEGRFDDPQREFRVLYCAERRLTALYEVLAPLRPDLKALKDFKAFVAPLPAPWPAGVAKLPMEWRLKRELCSGHLVLKGDLTDVTEVKILMEIELEIADLCAKHGFPHLDQSALRSDVRELTQAISRTVFTRGWSGIIYRSKIDDRKCASLFEGRFRVIPYGLVQPLREDFRLLREACEDLRISL
jgi:RES domain